MERKVVMFMLMVLVDDVFLLTSMDVTSFETVVEIEM